MSFLKYKSDHVPPLLKISRGCHLTWSKSPLYGWPKLHDLGPPQPHILSPPALPWFFHFSHTSLLLFLNSPTMFLPQGHCTGCFLEHSLPRKPLSLHPGLLADLSFSAGSSLIPLAKIGALSPTPITFWPLPSYTLHGFSQHLMWWPQGWASQISKCRRQNWPRPQLSCLKTITVPSGCSHAVTVRGRGSEAVPCQGDLWWNLLDSLANLP